MIKKILMSVMSFLVCVFLLSCNGQQQERNKKSSSNTNIASIQNIKDYKPIEKVKSEIDSLIITCLMFGTDSEKSFIVKSSNIKSEWVNFHNKEERGNISQEKVNELLHFIDLFYLKKQSIILSRREEPASVSDYPIIEVVGFLGNRKIFEEETILYSNMEFNPKFLEFYEFLDSLVKQK